MHNILPNPSFEDGWYNLDGIPELQVPNQWTFEWDEGDNPLDPDPWNVFVRPETRVLSRDFLPPEEHDLFIWDGDYTVKIFKGNGAISVRLATSVDLEPGRYRFEIKVFPDLVVGYTPDGQKIWAPDPLSGEARLYAGAGSTDWLLPTFGERNTLSYEFTLEQAGPLQLGVALRGRWAILNNGWFMDDWSLVGPIQETREQFLWRVSVAEQVERGIPLNAEAGLQCAIFADGMVPVHREVSPLYPGDPAPAVIQAAEDLTGERARRVYEWKVDHAEWFNDPN
jgi:hypothetical protein